MGLENKNESFEYLIEKSKTKMYKTAMAILKNDWNESMCVELRDKLIKLIYDDYELLKQKNN